jgi:CxxC motif-containing protein (DUF1111 family)
MLENRRTSFRAVQFVLLVLVLSLTLAAAMRPPFTVPATDPGVRGGPPGAGGPLTGLTAKEGKFFNKGLDEFNEVQSPTGSTPGTEPGLGPRFNLDSCAGCHAQPAVGGTSPSTNPQVARQPFMAPGNTLPSFIFQGGPVREMRSKSEGGGVHDLFVITGRPDAGGCNIAQLPFPSDVVFRIPTPVFGAGLIEAITDATIVANKGANAAAKLLLGISGHENREGNTGTVTRFGWKAQNKSLEIFAGEAYNVEQGVTNELFPQERDETAGCLLNPTPEDKTNYEETQPQKIPSNVVDFNNFMLFLAPPTPVTSYTRTVAPLDPVGAASINNGSALFTTVGCALCHTPLLPTGTNSSAVLNVKTANLFSDLLVHHMGTGLADGITQGAAGEDEFRTAPLWGLGQRIFFLHDGRTMDLLDAIQQHSSAGSEASGSVGAFNGRPDADKQDILNFLRSL